MPEKDLVVDSEFENQLLRLQAPRPEITKSGTCYLNPELVWCEKSYILAAIHEVLKENEKLPRCLQLEIA